MTSSPGVRCVKRSMRSVNSRSMRSAPGPAISICFAAISFLLNTLGRCFSHDGAQMAFGSNPRNGRGLVLGNPHFPWDGAERNTVEPCRDFATGTGWDRCRTSESRLSTAAAGWGRIFWRRPWPAFIVTGCRGLPWR
jgi:hypothetical protein